MTVEELVKDITNSKSIQAEIVNQLAAITAYRSDYNNTKFNREVVTQLRACSMQCQLYITKYTSIRGKSYNYFLNSYDRAALNNVYHQLQDIAHLTGNTATMYELLDDSILKKLVFSATYTQERNRRNDVKFDSNAKTLNLDMFSYTIFENYIKTLPKKLTGKDVTRYMTKLPKGRYRQPLSPSEEVIIAKYVKLLWNTTSTKSLALVKEICEYSFFTPSHVDMPFYIVRSLGTEIPPSGWCDTVAFDYYYFRNRSNVLGIPLGIMGNNIIESSVHFYVTGSKKKTAMSTFDIIYALDKIKILSADILTDTLDCPYYQMAIDQIVSELSRPENYKLLLPYKHKSKLNLNTLKASNSIINNIVPNEL